METTHTTTIEACSVASIEQTLSDLWREIGEEHTQRGHAVTRVCTLTLIAYGANQDLARRVRKALPMVYNQHPCRALLIEADGESDELSAWVTTVCQMPNQQGQQVCCEQITITVGENRRRRLPGTVLPLIVTDLPLMVWWPGPLHPASVVRDQLYAHADRWIVDSHDFADPLADLARLHTMIVADQHTAVSDLAWARLTPWRTIIAQMFDHPTLRPALDTITSISIALGQWRSMALLGVGWITSVLGWTLHDQRSDAGTLITTWRAAHGLVTVQLLDAQADQGGPTIALNSGSNGEIQLHVERNAARNALVCQVARSDGTITQAGELRPADDGTLLNAELRVYTRDRVFEAALAAVAQIHAARSDD